MMANVVIIGAGLTGLSTAYHLEKKGFFDYVIFEKEPNVGGLCRSVQQDGFTFDYTGHLLHAADPYFRQFLETIVGLENLNSIFRRSYIYSHGVYTRYPYQINLFGLPTDVIVECIESFVAKHKGNHHPRTFHDWVLRNFGAGIATHFFFPFQQKIFAYDLKKVTATWMGRFVPQTSLNQMINGAIADNQDKSIGYNAQFFYPKRGGIQFWIEKLKNQISNPIRTKFSVAAIDCKRKIITFTNGHQESFKILINTMPLDNLITVLSEKSDSTVARAQRHLVCNSVINFNLGVNHSNLSDKHWIYFPETQYPFYRIGFAHNFASSMVPVGHSSLYGEYAFIKKSDGEQQKLTNQAVDAAKKLLNIDDHHIVTKKIITIPHAYVIYNFWREKNLPTLLKQLENQSIYSIGRYGAWKYSSMQEAVLDGKTIADTIAIQPASRTFYNPYIGIQEPTAQKEVT